MKLYYARICTNYSVGLLHRNSEWVHCGLFDTEVEAIVNTTRILDDLYSFDWIVNGLGHFSYQFVHNTAGLGDLVVGNIWQCEDGDIDVLNIVPYEELLEPYTPIEYPNAPMLGTRIAP